MDFTSGCHSNTPMFDYFFEKIPEMYRKSGYFIKANHFNLTDQVEFCQYYESFHELKILEACQGLRHIPKLHHSVFDKNGLSILVFDEYKPYTGGYPILLTSLRKTLDQLHGWNIFHNDISPWNLMLDTKSGDPILIDFNGSNFGFGSRYSYAWNKIVDPCKENDLAMLAITCILIKNKRHDMSGDFFQKIVSKEIYPAIRALLKEDGKRVLEWVDSVLDDQYEAKTPSGGKAAGVNPYIVSISKFPV